MGWSNDQATNLDGQAVTYTNSTTDYSTGSSLAVESDATFTINGLSPSLGIVARGYSATELPVGGTTAAAQATAGTVMGIALASAVLNRIYLVQCPGLTAQKNIAGGSGFQLTYTEDGSAPAPTSALLAATEVAVPVAAKPYGAAFGVTYTRRVATGPLRVLLSTWVVSGGGATVASALAGERIELLIIDMGLDPNP